MIAESSQLDAHSQSAAFPHVCLVTVDSQRVVDTMLLLDISTFDARSISIRQWNHFHHPSALPACQTNLSLRQSKAVSLRPSLLPPFYARSRSGHRLTLISSDSGEGPL